MKKKSVLEETVFVYNASGMLVAEYSTELNEHPAVGYLTADHLGSPRIVTDGVGAVRFATSRKMGRKRLSGWFARRRY